MEQNFNTVFVHPGFVSFLWASESIVHILKSHFWKLLLLSCIIVFVYVNVAPLLRLSLVVSRTVSQSGQRQLQDEPLQEQSIES